MFSKLIIFWVLFLDVLGIAIIIPAFPELKAYYQINDFQVTLWLTLYSACAFFATPRLGQISDKYGRKRPLVACVLGTCISYLILLWSQSYRIFLLSRILNGITGGNTAIIQAILTDISPDTHTKTKHYGWMWAIFGIWFIIGPLIGSVILSLGHVTSIFWFGALFALIEVILLITHFQDKSTPSPTKKIRIDTLTVLKSYLTDNRFQTFLYSMFFLGTGSFIINATQSLYMNTRFGVSGVWYGYFLAFAGLISAYNMWVLVPKFWTRMYWYKTLIRICHSVLIIWYSIIGMTHSIVVFSIIFYLIVLGSGAYITVYNTTIMSQARPDEIGTMFGVLWSLQNLSMICGPLIGWLLMSGGYNVFVASVICFIMSLIMMLRYLIRKSGSFVS
jgi:DHA1 family tetracycline resistance protein-like MFS transporter